MKSESRNYWKISKISLFFFCFVFFDTKEYLADRLFIRHKVRVWFGREYVKKDCPFVLIFCKIRKKDLELFSAALDEMERTMLLKGYSDYPDFCAEMDGMIRRLETA